MAAGYFSTTALSDLTARKLEESLTSIELLRLSHSSTDSDSVLEVDSTFEDNILDHVVFEEPVNEIPPNASNPTRQSFVQILFLSSIRDHDGCTTKRIRVTQNILESLCVQLGISSAFLEAVLIPSVWSKQSGASCHRYDAAGEVQALAGFYHYFEHWDLGPLHLWFRYNTLTSSTTYVLIDCPGTVQERIRNMARSQEKDILFQPLAIDFLVAEECALWREVFINERWNELFHWNELSGNRMNPPIRDKVLEPNHLQDLHTLSRTWNMLFEDLGDLGERLDFLIETSQKLKQVGIKQSTSAAEAFQLLHARNKLQRRWVTKLISHFVNQASLDNATTKMEIADQTRKDNYSMITIARMGMLFLPGTFISSIFSMVFFTFNGTDSTIDVSPWVWLYYGVTVSLTVLVFGLYLYWRRRRDSRRGQGLKSEDENSSEMWDSMSIAPMDSGVTEATLSTISQAAAGGAAEEVASILAGKDEIRHLMVKGFQIMDIDKFERNLRRCLVPNSPVNARYISTEQMVSTPVGVTSSQNPESKSPMSASMDLRSVENETRYAHAEEQQNMQSSGTDFICIRSPAMNDASLLGHKPVFPPFSLIKNFRNIIKRKFRPNILPGRQRILWKCKCGDDLFVDLSIHSTAEAARLASILQCSGVISGPTSSHTLGPVTGARTTSPVTSSGRSSSNSSQLTNSSSPLTLVGSNSSLSTPIPPPTNQAYLELCVNTGKYSKTLSEINLRGVSCDGELFRRIRAEYSRLQPFKSKIWLMTPAAVHFVKFSVQDPLQVGILQKPLSIPPREEVDAKNYIYAPCPLEGDPPMPEDIFLHYLSCKSFEPAPAWLPRLPKKLDSSILRFTGAINEGWGIHINEGPNWIMIAVLNAFMMLVSGAVAFLWKYYKGDFQGAFGFAAWIVMVVDSILMAYIVKHSQG